MLLYIDKKKEKNRRIKIIALIFCCIFIIIANVIHFKTALYHTKEKLTAYQPFPQTTKWFKQTSPVYLFSSRQKQAPKVIIIPTNINKDNAKIIALVFSKLPKKQYFLNITPEINETQALKKIIYSVQPQTNINKDPADIILTTDFKQVQNLINTKKLYPTVFTYNQTQKDVLPSLLTKTLEEIFPEPPSPSSKLQIEKAGLKSFTENNRQVLKKMILNKEPLSLAEQKLFLPNNRFCLVTSTQTLCNTSKNLGLNKTLPKTLAQISQKQQLKKIIFWTSDKQINEQEVVSLKKDEGIIFRYKKRKTFLLPKDILSLANKKESLYILKEMAGLNPQYIAPEMKFYKFKTLEVDLND